MTTIAPMPPAVDLHCPLCGYSLRGLPRPQCPECGFSFDWDQLIHAHRDRHAYLYEYGPVRSVSRLLKTYWHTARPRRFWASLRPTHDVRVGRLLLYWLLTGYVLAGAYAGPLAVSFGRAVSDEYTANQFYRSCYSPDPNLPGYQRLMPRYVGPRGWPIVMSPGQLDYWFPPPWSWRFYVDVWDNNRSRLDLSDFDRTAAPILYAEAALVLWPWLTLAALSVFQFSIRRANLRSPHVARAVVYGCDAGILLTVLWTALLTAFTPSSTGAAILLLTAVLPVVLTYRLGVAFGQYLHLHRPFATAAAVQAIAWLATALAVAFLFDLGRRV